ncbi:MAG: BlaI/MecI/CopY family transcriptional regulator [Planctomycetota bacterium]
MARANKSEPSPSEWKVLRFVWERGSVSARDVTDAFGEAEGWAPSTAKTLLRRLVQKGHLATKGEVGSLVYAPKRSPKRALFDAAEELLGRAREDTVAPLLAHLVKQSELTSEQLAELRRLVEDEEKRRSK